MDGNLAMAHGLENQAEPGDYLESTFPELSIITIATLERVYMELIQTACIAPKITDFIDFIEKSIQK